MSNASSWNNGNPNHITGSGLGIHIDGDFQQTIFNQGFNTIELYCDNHLIAQSVNVNDRTCKELIHNDIGRWLITNNWNVWPNGQPFRFNISQSGNTNRFDITIENLEL